MRCIHPRPTGEGTGERMYDAFTPGRCGRSIGPSRTGARDGSSVEPIDLLAALVDEAESRAAELMAQFGLDPARVLNCSRPGTRQSRRGTDLETPAGEAR